MWKARADPYELTTGLGAARNKRPIPAVFKVAVPVDASPADMAGLVDELVWKAREVFERLVALEQVRASAEVAYYSRALAHLQRASEKMGAGRVKRALVTPEQGAVLLEAARHNLSGVMTQLAYVHTCTRDMEVWDAEGEQVATWAGASGLGSLLRVVADRALEYVGYWLAVNGEPEDVDPILEGYARAVSG